MTITTAPTRGRRLRWPLILTGLLAFQATGMITFVAISARDPSFATEPNYYEKALAWDDTARQRQASAALGWTAAVTTAPSAGGRTLSLTLRDALDRPLDGARISVVAYHHARAAERITAELSPMGEGVYTADVPVRRPGHWQVALTVARGPELFTTTQQIEITQ